MQAHNQGSTWVRHGPYHSVSPLQGAMNPVRIESCRPTTSATSPHIPEHRYQVEEDRARTVFHSEEGRVGEWASTHPEGTVHQLHYTRQKSVVTPQARENFTSVVSRRRKSPEDGRGARWQSERHLNREMLIAYINKAAELARAQSRQEHRSMQEHLSSRISEQVRAAADRVTEENRRFLSSATDSLKAEGREEYRSMQDHLSSRISEQVRAAADRVTEENRRFLSSATDSLEAKGRKARAELERIVEEKLQHAVARPDARDVAAGEVEMRDLVKEARDLVQGLRQYHKVTIEEEVAASRCLEKQLEQLEVPSNDLDHRRHTIAHEGYLTTSLTEIAKKNQRKHLQEAAKPC